MEETLGSLEYINNLLVKGGCFVGSGTETGASDSLCLRKMRGTDFRGEVRIELISDT